MGQKVCSAACSYKKVIADSQKLARKQNRQMKAEFNQNDKGWNFEQAQKAFNAFVRRRDQDLPCVSCGTLKAAQWHCSHLRSVGAAGHLRFTEDNGSKSCSVCNQHFSGNITNYRIELIKRIGATRVEALETNNEIRRWTIPELQMIATKYKIKLKELNDE